VNLRSPRKRADFLLDITPLVDVVFLMLIFFMVSTTFDTAARIKIELPPAHAKQEAQEPKQITISIDAAGRIFIQDEEVDDAHFDERVLYYTKGDPTIPIVLRADAEARHKRIVFVLDRLSELNIGKIGIATQPIEEEQ